MKVFRGIRKLFSFSRAYKNRGRHPDREGLGLVENAAMVSDSHGRIVWVGQEKNLKGLSFPVLRKGARSVKEVRAMKLPEVNLKAQTVFPGFVESHTHLIFAGTRSLEFEERLRGVSYLEIGKRGGGIRSTVTATRAATSAHLRTEAQARARRFLSQGVTTLEAKSGYGLSLREETRMLQILKGLKGPRMVATFLGLHALAPEFKSYDAYFSHVLKDILPVLHRKKLAERVDIFVDEGYFTTAHAESLFDAARDLGLDCVVHADQLTRTGISVLAAARGAKSVDHVLQVSDDDILKVAKSEATAVLLPAADLYLGLPYPRARRMIDAGVRVALATDFNPGSAPTMDLALVGWLARKEMKMTLEEVFTAYTVGGAFALGKENDIGHLSPGANVDFISSDHELQDFFYQVGEVPKIRAWISGSEIFL